MNKNELKSGFAHALKGSTQQATAEHMEAVEEVGLCYSVKQLQINVNILMWLEESEQ